MARRGRRPLQAGCVFPQVPDGVPPGTLVTTLQAKDPDAGENGTILYTLTGRGWSKRSWWGTAGPRTCPALEPQRSSFLRLSPGPGSELFSLHPHSGELLTAAPLIRAERPHYVLTLSAHDQGSPPRSSSLQLLVQVWLRLLPYGRPSVTTDRCGYPPPGAHLGTLRCPPFWPPSWPAQTPFYTGPPNSVLPPGSPRTGASLSSLGRVAARTL